MPSHRTASRPPTAIMPALGAQQPGDHVEHAGLARARWAEQHRHARPRARSAHAISASPRRSATSTSKDMQPPPRPPREPFGRDQRRQRQRDRDRRQPPARSRRRRAAAARRRSPAAASASRPGTFDTKVIVAPNSPSARAKPSTAPGEHAGQAERQRDRRGTRASAPPRASAPRSSSRRSTASIDSRIARTISGSAITPAAIAAPVQRNSTLVAEPAEQPPRRPGRREREQQQPAGHHRRHHQRQMDQRVEQHLAGKPRRAQQPGERERERQRRERGDPADLQRQPDDAPFVGRSAFSAP